MCCVCVDTYACHPPVRRMHIVGMRRMQEKDEMRARACACARASCPAASRARTLRVAAVLRRVRPQVPRRRVRPQVLRRALDRLYQLAIDAILV